LFGVVVTKPNNNNNNMPDKNDFVKLSSPFVKSNRILHLLVRSCLEASPFELLMMVLLQCCCGDDKTTNHISMTTRPNRTYDIWMSFSKRPKRVSVVIVPIETDLGASPSTL
jgi:hypothetical protein